MSDSVMVYMPPHPHMHARSHRDAQDVDEKKKKSTGTLPHCILCMLSMQAWLCANHPGLAAKFGYEEAKANAEGVSFFFLLLL